MKCIRFCQRHGGHVARVTEKVAAEKVSAGEAFYCPKRWFKAAKLKKAAQ